MRALRPSYHIIETAQARNEISEELHTYKSSSLQHLTLCCVNELHLGQPFSNGGVLSSCMVVLFWARDDLPIGVARLSGLRTRGAVELRVLGAMI